MIKNHKMRLEQVTNKIFNKTCDLQAKEIMFFYLLGKPKRNVFIVVIKMAFLLYKGLRQTMYTNLLHKFGTRTNSRKAKDKLFL